MAVLQDERFGDFRQLVRAQGEKLYRDLPWRRTRDPYAIWISEVMLQQTQVARVDGRWQRWLERFPTVEALAYADSADVLQEWQGMGYNRRALSLLRAARAMTERGTGFPSDTGELVRLPGIGPATAAGIRAFAFDLSGVYLETNVRSVFLHELFPGESDVSDKQIIPLVEKTCPAGEGESGFDAADDPRSWYYALLDYGAWLKKAYPNPSRRSKTHVRQSRFEGSHRQKRAELLKILLAHRDSGEGPVPSGVLVQELNEQEQAAGRSPLTSADVASILEELEAEGFCHHFGDNWLA